MRMGWPGLWLLLGMLAGCASAPGDSAPGDLRERATASDQSESERRARVRLELASAYFAQGQTDTALDELKLSIAAAPQLGEAYNLRGLIYASLGEDALAEESFRRALQLDSRDGATLHNYGWYLCQHQKYEPAQTQFLAALALPQYRDASRTLLARGICLTRMGKWTEAEAALMRAYELDPANPSTALNLSEVLVRRGELARARFYVARVNAQPTTTNAQSLWLAARIEYKLGNSRSANELGEQMRVRFPKAPEVSLFERGRFDD